MFGGYDGANKNDLWWYDPASGTNGTWIRQIEQDADGSPPARWGHSMAWDTVSQRVIMFGGFDGSTYFNDLWWYDPVENTWSQMQAQDAPDSPTARYAHSIVWDGQKVIMFGGIDSSNNYKNDLWWYEPTSGTNGAWIKQIEQDTVGSPSVRRYHSMVRDGQKVIMFGGFDGADDKNDLWWYDPGLNTWAEMITNGAVGSPSARWGHSMVWDTASQRVIMFGGLDDSNTFFKNDLWWYDPGVNTWAQQIAVGSPSAREFHSMVWDGTRVIMFGGNAAANKKDLWWW
jgi:N-acetylneuraminic acid mutarotase